MAATDAPTNTTAIAPSSRSSAALPDRYRFVGRCYELLTRLASGSAIHRCRLHAASGVARGDRVLFVGAGHGTDALDAAARGAVVTVVELSATMLACLRRRDGADALRLIHGDAFEHAEQYDLVVANFFLNVFPGDLEARMRRHLASLVDVDGRFVIGDFARANGVFGVIATAHWYLALTVFRVLSGNAIHPQSDHIAALVTEGFHLVDDRRFSVLGLPLYASQSFARDA